MLTNKGFQLAIGLALTISFLPGWRAHAEEDPGYDLPPVVVEGSPSDLLLVDPVISEQSGDFSGSSASGSVLESLRDQLPVSAYSRGTPGSLTTFRGLGSAADDTNVQTLGIPLNGPQGGGFDLSTFPQFLWSGYRFQLNPSAAAFDPSAVSGTLTLVPWTQRLLSEPVGHDLHHISEFYSSESLTEVSAGSRYGDVAWIAGYSDGHQRGPSGSLSGKWDVENSNWSGQYHLLFTRVESDLKGSRSFPTPHATQLTARAIPVFEADYRVSSRQRIKTSFFYDGTYIRADDPDDGTFTRDQIRQEGFESAALLGSWKLGVSIREIQFHQTEFAAPGETAFHSEASRVFMLGGLTLDAGAQVVGLSRYGLFPQGSVGVRHDFLGLAGAPGLFLRLSYSRKFPSLQDRYYQLPGLYQGNPALAPENDMTAVTGIEARGHDWNASLQLYGQLRRDAQVDGVIDGLRTRVNAGEGRVRSLLMTASYSPWNALKLTSGVSFSASKTTSTGAAFPYLPTALATLGAEYSRPGSAWSAAAELRGASSSSVPASNDRLPGYGYFDLSGRYRLFRMPRATLERAAYLSLSVQNAFDRPIEFIQDYPSPGRVYLLALQADI